MDHDVFARRITVFFCLLDISLIRVRNVQAETEPGVRITAVNVIVALRCFLVAFTLFRARIGISPERNRVTTASRNRMPDSEELMPSREFKAGVCASVL